MGSCHSVGICCSVTKFVSSSLRPHGPKHSRFPCSSLSPGVCLNSCPLNQWCHLTISSSVSPLSSCPQSFPASGSFPTSWLFLSGGQSIGISASVLPMNIQGWFPLGLTGLISLLSKGLSESSPAPQFESINSLKAQLRPREILLKLGSLKAFNSGLLTLIQNFYGRNEFLTR